MRYCKYCGNELSEKYKFCDDNCRESFNTKAKHFPKYRCQDCGYTIDLTFFPLLSDYKWTSFQRKYKCVCGSKAYKRGVFYGTPEIRVFR